MIYGQKSGRSLFYGLASGTSKLACCVRCFHSRDYFHWLVEASDVACIMYRYMRLPPDGRNEIGFALESSVSLLLEFGRCMLAKPNGILGELSVGTKT